MIVDDERKFLFVCVAKTASTSMRERFGYSIDPPPEEYHMFLSDGLVKYPQAKNYFKFGFVRNPYDRLFSTYINLKYDGHPWAVELKRKASFQNFVMDFKGSKYSSYIHLQPQWDYLSLDGELGVDFVGKFENLIDDFKTVEGLIGFSHKQLKKKRWSSKNIERKFYDDKMKEIVQEVYAIDFERFGYEK